jgi:translocation and assembly module TamA
MRALRYALVAILLLPLSARAQDKTPPVTVEVLGVEAGVRKNVLASLSIADKDRRKNATEAELRHLHSRAEEEIRRAVQPFGYYRPFVRAELLTGTQWTARYEIEPGPPLMIDSLTVQLAGEGAANPKFQEVARSFPLQRGDVLLHSEYERGKEAFKLVAAEGGYLDARFTASRITVDLARYAAAIVVRFDTGPRHYFGEVTFDREVLKPHLLRRYPNFQAGEPFDFRKLLDLQTDLTATGYFTRVEVNTGEEDANHRVVPVIVSLAPARKVRLTGGVGFGTDDGLRVRGLAELRRTNRQGHRAQLEGQWGQKEKRAGVQYFIPWPNPRTDVVTFSSSYHDFKINAVDSRIFQTGATASRLYGQWRAVPALSYRRENYVVGVDRGIVKTLLPEGTWSRVRADDPLQTWRGDRVSFNVRGAHERVVSDVSLLQGRVDGKLIQSLGQRSRGIARFEVGATKTGDFRELPASLRFFAGGANSVRGYGYNTLGPRDVNGDVIGGPYLLVGSLEAEHRFLPRWGGALFFDMGNAVNSFGDRLDRGAGAGVRWVSPAGLVRVDFGWGLDRERTPLTVHVTLGPEL